MSLQRGRLAAKVGVRLAAFCALVLASVLAAMSCGGESQQDKNKALVRYFIAEGWNKGDVSISDEVLAPNYVLHAPLDIGLKGIEAHKQFFSLWHTGIPDYYATINHLIAEDDKVAVQLTLTGTHKGALFGFPATGKRVKITSTVIMRLVGGKVVEEWVDIDNLGALQQLGLLPSPAQQR